MSIKNLYEGFKSNNLKQIADKLGVDLKIAESDDFIELSKIVVPKSLRGSGVGTKIMKALIQYADSKNKTITLTPSSDFGGNVSKLKKWYMSLGFVMNSGRNKDYEISDTMYRPPEFKANEARREPELNPKISAYEALKKYKDDPNVYISFTDLNKVGIKPLSEFNTPNGIYTYPLKEIWQKYNVDSKKSLGKAVPFAGDRKFIQVIKWNGKQKFVEDMYKDYTSKNYDEDLKKLRNMFPENVKAGSDSINYKSFYEGLVSDVYKLTNEIGQIDKTVKGKFMNLISDLAKKVDADKFRASTVMEFNADVLTLLSNAQIDTKMLKKFHELIDFYYKKVKEAENIDTNIIDFYEIQASKKARHKSPVGMFWYITFMLSNDENADKALGSHSNTQKWNNLLRKLGYTGFGDKSGRGLIHPSEPIQAFFLSKDATDHVETILNKDYAGAMVLDIIKPTDSNEKVLKAAEADEYQNVYNFTVNYPFGHQEANAETFNKLIKILQDKSDDSGYEVRHIITAIFDEFEDEEADKLFSFTKDLINEYKDELNFNHLFKNAMKNKSPKLMEHLLKYSTEYGYSQLQDLIDYRSNYVNIDYKMLKTIGENPNVEIKPKHIMYLFEKTPNDLSHNIIELMKDHSININDLADETDSSEDKILHKLTSMVGMEEFMNLMEVIWTELEPTVEQYKTTNARGDNVLHMIVRNGVNNITDPELLVELLKFFKEKGIDFDINAKNETGKTPKDLIEYYHGAGEIYDNEYEMFKKAFDDYAEFLKDQSNESIKRIYEASKFNINTKLNQVINYLNKFENIIHDYKRAQTTKSIYVDVSIYDDEDELIDDKKLRISDHQDVYATSDFTINPFEDMTKAFKSWVEKHGIKKPKKSRFSYDVSRASDNKVFLQTDDKTEIEQYKGDNKYVIRKKASFKVPEYWDHKLNKWS